MPPDEETETAESHKKSQAHFLKAQEFQEYKCLYLAEIHPRLMKEDELRKMVEDLSSCGKKTRMDAVALDMERLERSCSTVKNEVQTIESSLEWTNTSSLLNAVEEFKAVLQNTEKLLEQGIREILIGIDRLS